MRSFVPRAFSRSPTERLGGFMGRLSNRTPFTGTAWHYARYRPGYPSVFFTDLVERFHLDGQSDEAQVNRII
jgi:hypothetical protein